MPWDEGLEGPALEIARTDRNPVRVDAGPGTGKTFALMRRIWRLIAGGGDPRRLFVGTFTRTAASDLKKSLSDLGIPGVDNIRAGTIHAYCFGLLAKHEVFEWTRRTPRPLLSFEGGSLSRMSVRSLEPSVSDKIVWRPLALRGLADNPRTQAGRRTLSIGAAIALRLGGSSSTRQC